MRAISLYHPHAMLVALGEKLWETRGRQTHHRGLIAIHAGKRFDLSVQLTASSSFFATVLHKHGIGNLELQERLGGIVALAEITEVITSMEWNRRHCRRPLTGQAEEPARAIQKASEQEYRFGNYEPGRFAWKLENIRRVEPFVPAVGRQWIWSLPPEIEALCLERVIKTEQLKSRVLTDQMNGGDLSAWKL